jgi:hypothetical protein
VDWLRKEEYGQVPRYLIDRRLELAAAYAEEQVPAHHLWGIL